MQNINVNELLEKVKNYFLESRIRISGDKQEVRMNVSRFENEYFSSLVKFRSENNCKIKIKRSGTGIVIIFTPN